MTSNQGEKKKARPPPSMVEGAIRAFKVQTEGWSKL